ncbi:hypothetical protein N2152v2_010549 [Parachlorella kessleri]
MSGLTASLLAAAMGAGLLGKSAQAAQTHATARQRGSQGASNRVTSEAAPTAGLAAGLQVAGTTGRVAEPAATTAKHKSSLGSKSSAQTSRSNSKGLSGEDSRPPAAAVRQQGSKSSPGMNALQPAVAAPSGTIPSSLGLSVVGGSVRRSQELAANGVRHPPFVAPSPALPAALPRLNASPRASVETRQQPQQQPQLQQQQRQARQQQQEQAQAEKGHHPARRLPFKPSISPVGLSLGMPDSQPGQGGGKRGSPLAPAIAGSPPRPPALQRQPLRSPSGKPAQALSPQPSYPSPTKGQQEKQMHKARTTPFRPSRPATPAQAASLGVSVGGSPPQRATSPYLGEPPSRPATSGHNRQHAVPSPALRRISSEYHPGSRRDTQGTAAVPAPAQRAATDPGQGIAEQSARAPPMKVGRRVTLRQSSLMGQEQPPGSLGAAAGEGGQQSQQGSPPLWAVCAQESSCRVFTDGAEHQAAGSGDSAGGGHGYAGRQHPAQSEVPTMGPAEDRQNGAVQPACGEPVGDAAKELAAWVDGSRFAWLPLPARLLAAVPGDLNQELLALMMRQRHYVGSKQSTSHQRKMRRLYKRLGSLERRWHEHPVHSRLSRGALQAIQADIERAASAGAAAADSPPAELVRPATAEAGTPTLYSELQPPSTSHVATAAGAVPIAGMPAGDLFEFVFAGLRMKGTGAASPTSGSEQSVTPTWAGGLAGSSPTGFSKPSTRSSSRLQQHSPLHSAPGTARQLQGPLQLAPLPTPAGAVPPLGLLPVASPAPLPAAAHAHTASLYHTPRAEAAAAGAPAPASSRRPSTCLPPSARGLAPAEEASPSPPRPATSVGALDRLKHNRAAALLHRPLPAHGQQGPAGNSGSGSGDPAPAAITPLPARSLPVESPMVVQRLGSSPGPPAGPAARASRSEPQLDYNSAPSGVGAAAVAGARPATPTAAGWSLRSSVGGNDGSSSWGGLARAVVTAGSEIPSALERLKTARSSLTSGGQLRRSVDGAGLAGLLGNSRESRAGQVDIEARAGGTACSRDTHVKAQPGSAAGAAEGGVEASVDFKEISQAEALATLKASEKGLTAEEARQRLAEYGPNKLPEETRNPILVYLSYMWNPLSWAMECAAIIAVALLDWADFALILALLITNATISYVEESNADKAIKALTSALAPKAKAMRDGQVITLDAADLVPGDVIIVRLGDIVPADIKILGEGGGEHEETPLQVDQAALTGESLPVKKFSGDVAFAGSTIKQGERHCVVYATGLNTFFGRAAALLGGAQATANLQKIMTRIGAVCLITIGVWCVIELAVQFGHYNHSCYGGEGGCPTLTNMLVIVVGGIPIAMPTVLSVTLALGAYKLAKEGVLSVTLALGAYKLAKEGAIVSRMSAVEEMAGMNILCSDKTGTLTLNKLTVDVANVYPMSGHSIEDVLRYGAMSANIVTEEPIDMVLHESYAGKDTLWNENKIVKFVPFNPTDKYTIAFVKNNATGQIERVMKGAPQVVVRNAHNAPEITDVSNEKITEYANRGFRALGISKAPGDGSQDGGKTRWEMIGLVPLFDPPRHDTKETIERCLEMGIYVKMITGDQLLIGKETAKQLGMGTNMFTTEALLKGQQAGGLVEGHASVEELIENADGFAEVFPEHKFMIVKILQERGHMCGMTGDGVNDAPALKKADVGIAVAGATDAARGAADIVLTEPGLSTIISAVIGARKIFQRMTTYARYTVAMTFRICFTFGLLTVIYNWYFDTLLIVLLAVFNDGAMIALSKDKVTPSRLPNRWALYSIFVTGIVYGLYLTLSSWVLYYVATHMTFFQDKCHMFSLNTENSQLVPWCINQINQRFANGQPAEAVTFCAVPPYAEQVDNCANYNLLDQCVAEQRYFRNAMTRSLMYLQVSVSGQALVFVVRTFSHSFMVLAGGLTYVAFALAQICSTLIAIFGFNAYSWPRESWALEHCQFCLLSSGGRHPFFAHNQVPQYGTEAEATASVLGCTYYVIAAWIWAIIWHMGLDPIKWAMMYILNEEGIRQRGLYDTIFRTRGEHMGAAVGAGVTKHPSIGRVSARRSVDAHPSVNVEMGGRISMGVPGVGGTIRPTPAMLERASMVRVH